MVLDSLLSYRAGTTVASLNRPWRFAEGTTYDPETNPSGLVSFSTAENVSLFRIYHILSGLYKSDGLILGFGDKRIGGIRQQARKQANSAPFIGAIPNTCRH